MNHLGKLSVTSDASTILREVEVSHPAAKLMVHAANAQDAEVGDGANFVITLSGELIGNAEALLLDGLTAAEIVEGYEKAGEKCIAVLESLVVEGSDKFDARDVEQVTWRIRGAVSSKQYGYSDFLCKQIAEACVAVCPENPKSFNVDNVRVVKLPGGGSLDSLVVKGIVLQSTPKGNILRVKDAKVAVYSQGLDSGNTETKGTTLFRSAAELEAYSNDEEALLEKTVAAIAQTGVKLVVSGGSIGEMALHYFQRYKMMVLKIGSKFELRRFCRVSGASAISKFQAPTVDQIGFVQSCAVEEIGGAKVTRVEQSDALSSVCSIVIRGAAENSLDEIERCVDDGVNAYKVLCQDPRVVLSNGGVEKELAKRIRAFGNQLHGLDQHSVSAYADALDAIPKLLAENACQEDANEVSSSPSAPAAGADAATGDVAAASPASPTLMQEGVVYDLYRTKHRGIKHATEAALAVLSVDQIIMSKPAGGPQPPKRG